jgi:hypothetical protein
MQVKKSYFQIKHVALLASTLLLFTLSIGQNRQNIISEDSVINKWTHAVFAIDCSSHPDWRALEYDSQLYNARKIDLNTARRVRDSIINHVRHWWGTAIFAMIGNKHYLLTSRHVLADTINGDRNGICAAIVLVEDSTAPHNDTSGIYIIDRPITVDSPGHAAEITVTAIDPNFPILNFSFERKDVEVRAIRNLQNTDSSKEYFFSAIEDDIAIVDLDTLGIEGKGFVKTLCKRGYKPILLSDINANDTYKKFNSVLCFGFPDESRYGKQKISSFRETYEADFKAFSFHSKGFIQGLGLRKNFFEVAVYTSHGFSGGPVVYNNQLIGINSGLNKIGRLSNSPTIKFSAEFQSKVIKSSIVYQFLKAFHFGWRHL